MFALLSAQFLSALADNALLFAAIAMLKTHAVPDWQIPMLQEFFVVAFIVLAPFVGPLADRYSKSRVMMLANTMKFIGAAAMLLGLDPLLSYGLVGLGAAAYSPAKYGILRELVSSDHLVKANGMMEGSTIVAILLGAVFGGILADNNAAIALIAVCSCYLIAAFANFFIPKTPVIKLPALKKTEYISIYALLINFTRALKVLVSHPDTRLSLLGTSVFWGAGSTLRLLLVAWVPVALGIGDLSLAANLSGAVAIGIAVGAAIAARFIHLKNVNRVLPVGIAIGMLIMIFAQCTNLYMAIGLLILIGAAGGFYVVPLNALLQEHGHETVGAGNAVAVQNFFENCTMLLLVGLYILMQKNNIAAVQAATLFGAVVFSAIGLLAFYRLRKSH
jgi:LPLT family lysophospholipid transporter-like MFS transporter